MAVDDALNSGQSYSGAFKLFRQMQTVEDAKQLVYVLYVEASAVVPHKHLDFFFIAIHAADLDFGRLRMLVNLTALETRLTTASLSMERSP